MARRGAPGTDTAHLLCLGRNLVLSVISFNSAGRQIKFTTLTSASCREMSRAQLETGSGVEGVRECGGSGVKGVRRATLADIASKLLNFGHVSAPGLSFSLSRLGPATCFVLLDLRVGVGVGEEVG